MKVKTEKKSGRISGEAPKGFRLLIRERSDKRWVWELRRWTTRLAEGDEPTEKKAKQVLETMLGKHMMAAKENQMRRGELLQRLRYWLERRTYVVMHVLYSLENGAKKGSIVARAKSEEIALWKRDKERGIESPLPANHHRSKSPADVAALCVDYCVQLGIVGKEAMKWGTKMMGKAFASPDADDFIEVQRLERKEEKEQDEDFVEDEDDEVEAATPDTAGDE